MDDNGDDFELLRLMLRRSNILNPVQTVDCIEKTICYLKGEGVRIHDGGKAFSISDWCRASDLHSHSTNGI